MSGVVVARTVLKPHKNFFIALQAVYGIGKANSISICEACGISRELKVGVHSVCVKFCIRLYFVLLLQCVHYAALAAVAALVSFACSVF